MFGLFIGCSCCFLFDCLDSLQPEEWDKNEVLKEIRVNCLWQICVNKPDSCVSPSDGLNIKFPNSESVSLVYTKMIATENRDGDCTFGLVI